MSGQPGSADDGLRICRVSEYVRPSPGGKEIHVEELTRAQVAAGHEVDLYYRFGSPVSYGARLHCVRVPSHYLSPISLPFTAAFCAAARVAIGVRHRRTPFHVVHLHGDWLEALLGGHLRRSLGIPAVLTIHAWPSDRWTSVLRRAIAPLERVICVGSAIRDRLVESGADPAQVEVISSGTDVERVRQARVRGAELRRSVGGSPVVVFAGSLEPMKGADVLLAAFPLIRQELPDAVAIILGDGPTGDAVRAAVTPGVQVRGRVSRDEVFAWLNAADVLAVPSRVLRSKGEGFPTVIIEALAAGTPVVASGIDSLRDVSSGSFIQECAADDPKALADALLRVLRNPGLQDAERETIREILVEKDWPATAARITEILRAARVR